MADVELKNVIDCTNLSSGEVDFKVKNLLFENIKNIVLKNTSSLASDLLEGIRKQAKIEVIGNVGNRFSNNVNGLKILVNGNIGDDSAVSAVNSKFIVIGEVGINFARGAKSSEFYIFENCGKSCFCGMDVSSKVVIGGQAGNDFAHNINGGSIVILNLKGGNIFIDDNVNWLQNAKDSFLYIRGDCKISSSRFLIEKAGDNDEDIYLPLISEFARLFKYSLSEIKSKPFYRIILK